MEKSDHFPLLTLGSMMTKRWRRKWGEGCQKTIRNRLSSQIPWKLFAVFFFRNPQRERRRFHHRRFSFQTSFLFHHHSRKVNLRKEITKELIVVLGGEHLGASRGVIGDDAIQARTDEPVRVTRPHHVLLAEKSGNMEEIKH